MDRKRLECWISQHGLRRCEAVCFACGAVPLEMLASGWHVGHVISSHDGGNRDVTNLRPICAGCNLDMGTTNMFSYIENKPGAPEPVCPLPPSSIQELMNLFEKLK